MASKARAIASGTTAIAEPIVDLYSPSNFSGSNIDGGEMDGLFHAKLSSIITMTGPQSSLDGGEV